MSKKVFLTSFIIVFAIGLFFSYQKVSSYSPYYTHPDLTEEVAKLFSNINKNGDRTIGEQEIQWMRQGAIEEDEPARWINHFFDPTTGKGWTGSKFGYLTPEQGLATVADVAAREPIPSTDWVTNQEYQAAYGRQFGNQTWQKAIRSYVDGDREAAFIALGHVLHIVEDSSVPDHTRDDTHADMYGDPGSPYEKYSRQYTNFNKLKFADSLKDSKFINFSDIQTVIKDLATYTNNNFFSEDTIIDQAYGSPNIKNLQHIEKEIDGRGVKFIFDKDKNIYLAMEHGADKYTVNEDQYVLPSYVEHLMPKAVLYGASAINLFFNEVDKYKNSGQNLKIVKDQNVPFAQAFGQPMQVVKYAALQAEKFYSKNGSEVLIALNNAISALPNSLASKLKLKLGFGTGATASNKTGEVTAATPVQSAPSPAPQVQLASATVTPKPPPPIILSAEPAQKAPEKKIVTLVAKEVSPSLASLPPPVSTVNQSPSYMTGGTVSGGQVVSESPTRTLVPADTQAVDVATTSTSTNEELSHPSPLFLEGSTTTVATPPVDISPPPAPTLDNFFAEIIYTTSSAANIFGTNSTDTVKILVYYATTTPSPSVPLPWGEGVVDGGNWMLGGASLEEGKNYFWFAALDADGNTSTLSMAATLVVDNDPPPVPTLTIDNQSGLGSSNLRLTVTGEDALSPTTFFDIDYTTGTVWTNFVSSTTTHVFDYSGARGLSYNFRVRAKDNLNNTSAWSDETASSTPVFVNWSNEVVINEVAWAGTSSDYPNDEWLELYNNTDQPIDLKDWKILVSGKAMNYSRKINTVIPSRGYFLLERTRDETLREVSADIVYTLGGGFNNNGEKLEVFKPNGEKTDEVDNNAGWFAGDKVKYRSMERLNALKNGNDKNNWQSNHGSRAGARTYNGGDVYGSPKQSNFGFIVLNSKQEDKDRNLTKENNPYILKTYEIPAGFTLNIGPGVVIKGYYPQARIDIYGGLTASGTVEMPATLTSGRDHGFNNSLSDTVVGAWSGVDPAAKDWQGLWFHAGSKGDMNNFNLRYAGHDFRVNNSIYTPYISQAVRSESAELTLDGGNFQNDGQLFLRLESSSSTISNSVFQGGDRAVESVAGNLRVLGSVFNNFTNAQGPLYARDNWPELKDLNFSGNALDLPFLEVITVNAPITIYKNMPLYLGNLTVTPTSALTIEPGAKINLANYATLNLQGEVSAVGVEDDPIIIAALSPSAYWGNIIFTNTTATLRYANISGGNHLANTPPQLDGMIIANNSNLTLDHLSLLNSRAPGNSLQFFDSTVTISDSTIGHSQKPALATIGIKTSGGLLYWRNTYFKNLNYGISNNSVPIAVLDATGITLDYFTNVDHPSDPPTWLDPWLLPTVASVADAVEESVSTTLAI